MTQFFLKQLESVLRFQFPLLEQRKLFLNLLFVEVLARDLNVNFLALEEQPL